MRAIRILAAAILVGSTTLLLPAVTNTAAAAAASATTTDDQYSGNEFSAARLLHEEEQLRLGKWPAKYYRNQDFQRDSNEIDFVDDAFGAYKPSQAVRAASKENEVSLGSASYGFSVEKRSESQETDSTDQKTEPQSLQELLRRWGIDTSARVHRGDIEVTEAPRDYRGRGDVPATSFSRPASSSRGKRSSRKLLWSRRDDDDAEEEDEDEDNEHGAAWGYGEDDGLMLADQPSGDDSDDYDRQRANEDERQYAAKGGPHRKLQPPRHHSHADNEVRRIEDPEERRRLDEDQRRRQEDPEDRRRQDEEQRRRQEEERRRQDEERRRQEEERRELDNHRQRQEQERRRQWEEQERRRLEDEERRRRPVLIPPPPPIVEVKPETPRREEPGSGGGAGSEITIPSTYEERLRLWHQMKELYDKQVRDHQAGRHNKNRQKTPEELENERKLQDYIRRNTPIDVSGRRGHNRTQAPLPPPPASQRRPDDRRFDDRRPEDRRPDDRRPEDRRPEDRRPDDRRPEDRRPEDRRPEDRRPEDRRPEDRRPDDRRPEDRRPDDRRPEDRRPEDRRFEDGRPEDERRAEDRRFEDGRAEDRRRPEDRRPEDEERKQPHRAPSRSDPYEEQARRREEETRRRLREEEEERRRLQQAEEEHRRRLHEEEERRKQMQQRAEQEQRLRENEEIRRAEQRKRLEQEQRRKLVEEQSKLHEERRKQYEARARPVPVDDGLKRPLPTPSSSSSSSSSPYEPVKTQSREDERYHELQRPVDPDAPEELTRYPVEVPAKPWWDGKRANPPAGGSWPLEDESRKHEETARPGGRPATPDEKKKWPGMGRREDPRRWQEEENQRRYLELKKASDTIFRHRPRPPSAAQHLSTTTTSTTTMTPTTTTTMTGMRSPVKGDEEERLRRPAVDTRLLQLPAGNETPPVITSRHGLADGIDFPGFSPDKKGPEASKFPSPVTRRPPAKSPKSCIWAIVVCCRDPRLDRQSRCFEATDCLSWDAHLRCRDDNVRAANHEIMQFYLKSRASFE